MECEGKNIGVKINKSNTEYEMKLNSFNYPDVNYLDRVVRMNPMKSILTRN